MTSRQDRVLVGLGEVLWDMLPTGRQLGGAPANFAYHAQALGARGVVASRVGDDDLGRAICRSLDEKGLELTHVCVDTTHPTSTVSVDLDDRGQPRFTIHEDVAWDFLETTPELLDLAAHADAVCFGSLAQRSDVSRKTICRFLEATGPDCLRVFDVNLRQHYYSEAIVRESLGRADVLKLSAEELPVVGELLAVTGPDNEMLGRLLEAFSLQAVALTRGEQGCLLSTANENAEHPGYTPGRIADTVGAGDAFTAALALGLLEGRPLGAVAAYANRLASYVCSQEGAMPSVPDRLKEIPAQHEEPEP